MSLLKLLSVFHEFITMQKFMPSQLKNSEAKKILVLLVIL